MVAIKTLISASALFSTFALADEAPENNDSGKKQVARAHLDRGLVKGLIEFTSDDSGAVKVHLDVTGLPPNAGPFHYHIHDGKVSKHGGCADAGELLNPYGAATDVTCDSFDNDSHCAVGDLSGKHGYINTTCFEAQYTDPYLSLNSRNGAFVGGKSIVITDLDHNTISCGAIKMKRSAKMKRELQDVTEEEDSLYESLIPEPVSSKNTTNSTYYEDETSDNFDSGANMLIASGLAGIVACGLSALM